MIRRVGRLLAAELTKVWRTRFPYLGLAASALSALIARQSIERLGAPGETTAASYLVTSINISSTGIIPIFSTIFAAMLIASETSRGTLRMILPRPIQRADFLSAKLLTGFIYLLLLFAANLAVALPIAATYPLRSAFDEDGPIPSLSQHVLIFALGIFLTLLPHAATVCFGFFVSVLSRSVATAIGVAVGLLLSLMPIQVFVRFGSFELSDWLFSSYYDSAMKIADYKTSGLYESWFQENIFWLVGTSAASSLVFLAIGYLNFTRRDLNE